MASPLRRIAVEVVGWVVLVAGILALVLPGPGLLLTLAGLAILSTQYHWASRLLRPVRVKAWRAAAEGVETIPRMALSILGALCLVGFGILWLTQPPAPSWWPVADVWWLFGGPAVGITLIVSAVIAVGLLGYAARSFRGHPEAVAQIHQLEAEHRARVAHRRRERARRRQQDRVGEGHVPTRGPESPAR